MHKWVNIEQGVIWAKHKQEFLKDYALVFKETNICASCPSKLNRYYENFKDRFIMKTKSENNFVVKERFNGVQLPSASNVFLTNARMTDALALRFLKEYPDGKNLFETLPDNVDEMLEGNKGSNLLLEARITELKELYKDTSLGELKEKFAPLTAGSKDKMIAKIAEQKITE